MASLTFISLPSSQAFPRRRLSAPKPPKEKVCTQQKPRSSPYSHVKAESLTGNRLRPKRVCRVQWKSCSCWELPQRVRSLQENHLSSGHQESMDQQKVHVAVGSKLNRRVWKHATGLGIWTLGRCTCLLFLYSKSVFTLKRVGENSCHAGRLVDYRLYRDIDKGNLGKLPNLLLPLSNAYPYILFSERWIETVTMKRMWDASQRARLN